MEFCDYRRLNLRRDAKKTLPRILSTLKIKRDKLIAQKSACQQNWRNGSRPNWQF